MTGFSQGWQGCFKGFSEGKAPGEIPTPSFLTLLLRFTFYF